MRKGKVETYMHELLGEKGSILISLIDPVDYRSASDAVSVAAGAAKGGADIILIGGSIGAQGNLLDDVTVQIKEKVEVPVILFPGNIATVTKHADAIYFMSLLNARNPYWITQAQMLSAPLIKGMGIEPLPLGYIVVSPGGTVGWVGDANFVPREKPKIGAALAMAGEFMGNRFILTDTGSNPSLQGSGPIPPEFVRTVKSAITVPYIVAGGIRTKEQLAQTYAAGADAVQIGTAFEKASDAEKLSKSFAAVAKAEGLKKKKNM